MSDLVGNPEDRFSHNEAHVLMPLRDADGIASGEDQSELGLHCLCENLGSLIY